MQRNWKLATNPPPPLKSIMFIASVDTFNPPITYIYEGLFLWGFPNPNLTLYNLKKRNENEFSL